VIVPTSEFVAIGFPNLNLGSWYTKLSYTVLHNDCPTY
jgi:sterol 3beta-glucosyltransferase